MIQEVEMSQELELNDVLCLNNDLRAASK